MRYVPAMLSESRDTVTSARHTQESDIGVVDVL